MTALMYHPSPWSVEEKIVVGYSTTQEAFDNSASTGISYGDE
jgi:hypothetical protein